LWGMVAKKNGAAQVVRRTGQVLNGMFTPRLRRLRPGRRRRWRPCGRRR
jgi:hypothetical protein